MSSDERIRPDAVIVGSGPNGLAAAITLARAGLAVRAHRGGRHAGGGCRTEELTLPVSPMTSARRSTRSPRPRRSSSRDGRARGHAATPEVAFAHPLDGGRAAAVSGSVEETAGSLGAEPRAYRRLLARSSETSGLIVPEVLAPMRSLPRHPLAMARFGLPGLPPVTVLARQFRTEEARALLAGLAAHSMLPLSAPGTGAFGLLLAMRAHAVGLAGGARAGARRLTEALMAELTALGGAVHTGRWVTSLDELPRPGATLLDVSPRQLLALAGERLPARYAGHCAGSGTGQGCARWTGR